MSNAIRIPRRETALSRLQESMLRTLLYFDVFGHPLTEDEIRNLAPFSLTSLTIIRKELSGLTQMGYVFLEEGYYYLRDKKCISRRKENTAFASQFIQKIPFFSKLISRFPFVRCVCISGSLSKGVMHPGGDIDYFIITEPGRLWVCRTLLMLFKKIFLLNSRKYFCLNYFISSDNLEIPDKNLFTATETAFLIPVYNSAWHSLFIKANEWHQSYYPSFCHPLTFPCLEQQSRAQRILEKIFSGKTGDLLDRFFLTLTLSRWKKKFGHYPAADFEVTFRSRSNVSKHHPRHFQKKVLSRFERNVRDYESAHGIHLYHGKDPAHA